jgi:hypothetical protein
MDFLIPPVKRFIKDKSNRSAKLSGNITMTIKGDQACRLSSYAADILNEINLSSASKTVLTVLVDVRKGSLKSLKDLPKASGIKKTGISVKMPV